MIREACREDIPACVNLIRHYSMQKKTIDWLHKGHITLDTV